MTADAATLAARDRYPLINGLYDRMIEIFQANTPDDDHIYPTPLAAFPKACEDLIGDNAMRCGTVIAEAIKLDKEGNGDRCKSGHTWGMAVLAGDPEHEHIETYSQVVQALFHSAMAEMLQQRDPELIDEGERKTKEWERKQGLVVTGQALPPYNLGEH